MELVHLSRGELYVHYSTVHKSSASLVGLSVPFQIVRAGASGTFLTVSSSDYFEV